MIPLVRHLVLALVCVAGLLDWLSARTQRLYVDEHADASKQVGTLWQHFALRGHNVVPQIVLRDGARLVFPLHLRLPQRLNFGVKPKGNATYEVARVQGEARAPVAAAHARKGDHQSIALPRGAYQIEFAVHGALELLDVQLVRPVFLWPVYWAA